MKKLRINSFFTTNLKEKNRDYGLATLAFLLLLSFPSIAFDWSWTLNTDGTYLGSETSTTSTVNGTYSALSNGFLQFSVSESTGLGPSPATNFYPVELKGFFLIVPPVLSTATQMTYTLSAGTCPVSDTTYNMMFGGWFGSSNTSLSTQAAFGTFTWDVSANEASIAGLYNVTNFSKVAWFPSSPLVLPASPCADGVSQIGGPSGTDRRGTLYMSSNDGFIYKTEANNTILGFPQTAITSITDLSGVYSAYDFDYNPSDSVSNNIKPMRVFITNGGTTRGNKLSSVASGTRDVSYGDVTLTVDALNSPQTGFFKATVSRGGNSSKMACMYYKTSDPLNVLACVGQNDATNSIPRNLVMVQQTLTTGGITCDSGSLATTCTVTSSEVVSDGTYVVANNLVIGSGGNLSSTGTSAIEVVGNITVQNGGTISGDYSSMIATDVTFESGGTFLGTLSEGTFANLYINEGASFSADGQGGAGGTGEGNGSGTCGGYGNTSGSGSDGASGGCYGGNSGQGYSASARTASTYGSLTQPTSNGSGGGSGDGSTVGGAGGGVIKLIVGGTLRVDGNLSANGLAGANGTTSTGTDGAGGGSGGSVWVQTSSLLGYGTISANGGAGGGDGSGGVYCGGGGSGGRIAITYESVGLTTNQVTVNGGSLNCNTGGSYTAAEAGAAGTESWSPSEPTVDDLDPPLAITRLRLWIDANDSETLFKDSGCALPVSNGDTVGCWKDKSGNDNHLTQTDGSREPTWTLDGSRQVVSFNADNLRQSTQLFSGTTVDAAEVFIVTRTVDDSSNNFVYSADSGANRFYMHAPWDTGVYMDLPGPCCNTRGSDSWSNYDTSGYYAFNTYGVSGTQNLASNGIVKSTDTGTMGNTMTGATLNLGTAADGVSNPFNGNIAEMLVYQKKLTDSERSTINAYLMDKWNIVPAQGSLRVWLDAQDINNGGAQPGTGGTISTWMDKSGNGNDILFTSGGSVAPPFYQTNSTDGSTAYVDFSAATSWGNSQAFTGWTSNELTIVAVFDPGSVASSSQLFSENTGNPVLRMESSDGTYRVNSTNTSVDVLEGHQQVVTMRVNASGTRNELRVNGDLMYSDTSGQGVATSPTIAFFNHNGTGTRPFRGKVKELRLYSKSLSDAELDLIESQLKIKWKIKEVPSSVADMVVWFDGNDSEAFYTDSSCSTLFVSDGDSIQCWKDKSGNGKNATVPSGAGVPVVDVAGQNGKNVADFTLDILETPSITFGGSGSVVFAVMRLDYSPSETWGRILHTNYQTHFWLGQYSNSNCYSMYMASSSGGGSTGCIGTGNAFDVLRVHDNTTNIQLYDNGSSVGTVSTSLSSKSYPLTIGGDITSQPGGGVSSRRLDGKVAEILIYNRNLSSTEISDIEEYLKNKWGL